MKTFHPILFATLALMFLAGTPVRGAEAVKDGAPKIIVVKFHADGCGACKAMGPVFTDLRNKLDGRPVLFVELDLTNATTRHQSMLLASALGLGRALKEHPGTGFILLFDEQRRVKGKLTARQSLKKMAAICTECE